MASKSRYITEEYLDKRLGRFKMELKVELKEELKEELYEIKDEIVGEIKGLREEFDAHQFSHTRVNDDLADHERRITKLEKTAAF